MPLNATRSQVMRLLKGVVSDYDREKSALRRRQLAEEKALADRYEAEVRRRAGEYGMTASVSVGRNDAERHMGYSVRLTGVR